MMLTAQWDNRHSKFPCLL